MQSGKAADLFKQYGPSLLKNIDLSAAFTNMDWKSQVAPLIKQHLPELMQGMDVEKMFQPQLKKLKSEFGKSMLTGNLLTGAGTLALGNMFWGGNNSSDNEAKSGTATQTSNFATTGAANNSSNLRNSLQTPTQAANFGGRGTGFNLNNSVQNAGVPSVYTPGKQSM